MKALAFSILYLFSFTFSIAQTKPVELYDLIKIFVQDTSEYETVGDWMAGEPDAKTVKWTSDQLEMSDDMKINFFMKGLVLVTLNGNIFQTNTKPLAWNLMLRGSRAGYDNFNLSSPLLISMKSKPGIDSLLGSKPFTKRLLKSCDTNPAKGFYYYQVKLPKKTTSYIKIAWNINASGGRIIIDCYDNHSKQYADLDCK